MKKTLLILVFAVISFTSLFSQRIAEDKIDDFNHKHIIRTSWGEYDFGLSWTGYMRFNKVDSMMFIELKIQVSRSSFVSVAEGKNFYLKFADDSIMGLEVLEHEITTIGGGAAGIMGAGVPGMILRLEVDPKQRIKMLSTPITKIRMQTEQGLWDEEFNDTKDQRLKGILKLIN